jgi:alpha-1,3-glucosyltransferase
MLGLTVWSLVAIQRERYVLASVLFCCALGFKHMALYYALAIFAYLLGICHQRNLLGNGYPFHFDFSV